VETECGCFGAKVDVVANAKCINEVCHLKIIGGAVKTSALHRSKHVQFTYHEHTDVGDEYFRQLRYAGVRQFGQDHYFIGDLFLLAVIDVVFLDCDFRVVQSCCSNEK